MYRRRGQFDWILESDRVQPRVASAPGNVLVNEIATFIIRNEMVAALYFECNHEAEDRPC